MSVDYHAIAARIRENHPQPTMAAPMDEYIVASAINALADAIDQVGDDTQTKTTPM